MLESKLDEVKITELSPDVVELVAPTLITIAPAGGHRSAEVVPAKSHLCKNSRRVEVG
jgi:hypothetical protein